MVEGGVPVGDGRVEAPGGELQRVGKGVAREQALHADPLAPVDRRGGDFGDRIEAVGEAHVQHPGGLRHLERVVAAAGHVVYAAEEQAVDGGAAALRGRGNGAQQDGKHGDGKGQAHGRPWGTRTSEHERDTSMNRKIISRLVETSIICSTMPLQLGGWW